MNTPQTAERDERTLAVENASYRWGYLFLIYAMLVDVVYRAGIRHEAAWDLMLLVVVGGGVCTMYQARQKVLAHGWAMKAVLLACLASVVAFVLVISRLLQ